MSRVIENDHPWDDFEIQYHIDRNRLKDIEKNRQDFPPGSEPKKQQGSEVDLSPETVDYVKSLSDEDLLKELESRGLSTDGEPKVQKFRLAQAVQKEKDANGS